MARPPGPSLLCLLLSLAACEKPRPPTEAMPSASAAPATAAAPTISQAVSSVRAPEAEVPPAAGMFAHVYIYDIDWRTGGHALFLRGDGSGIARVAGRLQDNVQNEKRYELPPSPERARKFRSILDGHRTASMKVNPMMAPGDAIAVVRMLPPTGPELALRGPAGRNESFRKLLLDLDKAMAAISVTGISPSYDGKLDPYWTPPFASPSAVVARHQLGRMKQGKMQAVATLSFDRRGSATLAIDEPGEEAEVVQRAWSEVSTMDELSVKSEQSDGDDHRLVGSKVRRGDKAYPAGVLEVLSARYGVFAVERKP